MYTLTPYLKAIVAFLAPALTQLAVDLGGGVSASELARNLVVAILTALVVWATPNQPLRRRNR